MATVVLQRALKGYENGTHRMLARFCREDRKTSCQAHDEICPSSIAPVNRAMVER